MAIRKRRTFLNLTQVKPLDVLLSTEPGFVSTMNRVAQQLSGGRKAEYSHAALALSSSVFVESLGKEGTVVNDLTDPQYGLSEKARAGQPTRTSTLHYRLVDGKIAVYVELQSKSALGVFRDERMESKTYAEITEGPRIKCVRKLADVYLAEYSILPRLLKSVINLPPELQSLTEKMVKPKKLPGPFCSELVNMLLGSSFDDETCDHSQRKPMDFAWVRERYPEVKGAVVYGLENLPGQECSKTLADTILPFLQIRPYDSQSIQQSILKIATIAAPVWAEILGADPQGRATLDGLFLKNLIEYRSKLVAEICVKLHKGPDFIWCWIAKANDCYAVCPGGDEKLCTRRKEQAAKELVLKKFMNEEVDVTFRHVGKDWTGERCSSAAGCEAFKRTPGDVLHFRLQQEMWRANAPG